MLVTRTNLPIDKKLPTPVYLQIAGGMISLIKQGLLQPGTALPSSRKLAEVLTLHRRTVVAAYEELLAQSWVEAIPRKGLFVAGNLPEVKPRQLAGSRLGAVYPAKTSFAVPKGAFVYESPFAARKERLVFNDGFPDTRLTPMDLLIREYRRFAHYKFTSRYLTYGPERGSENLRQELATFLHTTRGLPITADHLLITKGVQMALYLTSRVLLQKGDTVVVGEPGYRGASEVFVQAGAVLDLIPVDEEGIDTNVLESICQRKKVRLVYVIPHHHNPTTVTMSSARRMQLLELSRKYRFAILEDDYDFDFHYSSSPILPLASVDYDGSVIYVGSFCKIIAPAIRIGWMAAPANFIEEAARLRKLIDRQGEQLLEEAVANLLKNGDIGRHLKKVGKIYHERRDLLCSLLHEELSGRLHFASPDGGLAVWTKLAGAATVPATAEKARKLGLSISSGEDYYHRPPERLRSLRLGFASLNEREMQEAVELLTKAVK